MRADPERAKKTVKLSVFFELSVFARAKAAHGMLVKLTPVPNLVRLFTYFSHHECKS